MFWWKTKVLISIGLIVHSVAGNLGMIGFMPQPTAVLPLLLIVGGGIANLYHYLLLKQASRDISRPLELVVRKGAYRWCRHPMYFFDLVWCLGIALYPLSAVSLLLYTALVAAVIYLAQAEDAAMEYKFAEFREWRDSTRLLLPLPRLPSRG